MPAIPTEYPITLTDGTNEYEVFDATAFVNAVFARGHEVVRATATESPE